MSGTRRVGELHPAAAVAERRPLHEEPDRHLGGAGGEGRAGRLRTLRVQVRQGRARTDSAEVTICRASLSHVFKK